MLKVLIALVFLAMLISLSLSAGFLLKDPGSSTRVLTSLKVRVSLACLLLSLLVYGFMSGHLG
ncbi:DUF2909 domain-containing protein [Nitrincola tibetensis]|uniref:DUF2909 domain-containing protein n=1 Tax=Nitrincola tibetensis TaxID=2219697 RepID=A0A364NQG5_9GAMM|nr:DUF2909 family protein [Nitrincola tibetensis]RAU19272.1 DUF2909 domain-containing protein [Nitrincola tibetensis]